MSRLNSCRLLNISHRFGPSKSGLQKHTSSDNFSYKGHSAKRRVLLSAYPPIAPASRHIFLRLQTRSPKFRNWRSQLKRRICMQTLWYRHVMKLNFCMTEHDLARLHNIKTKFRRLFQWEKRFNILIRDAVAVLYI